MTTSTTTAGAETTAPPCNPSTQRIGRHRYDIGTTRENLEQRVRTSSEGILRAVENEGLSEYRLSTAQELASAALDIVDRSRESEPMRGKHIFTDSSGPEPTPGQTLFAVPEWQWKVEVAQILERIKGPGGSRMAEILEVTFHESDESPIPPPRALSFGFWGTWTRTTDLQRIPPTAAWTTMFELFGEPGKRSTHNDGLRDLLDSRGSRHWVGRLSFHRIETIEDFRAGSKETGTARPQVHGRVRDAAYDWSSSRTGSR